MRGVLVALLLVGCAEEPVETVGTCSARTSCPNELSAPLAGECGDASADPKCGAQYRAYYECRSTQQVCDGRGKLDEDASVAACSSQFATWTSCGGPPDTGTPTDTSVVMDTTVIDTGVDAKSDTRADTKTDTKSD